METNVIDRYFAEVSRVTARVLETQREPIEAAAKAIAEASLRGNNIFSFGCSHAGLLSLELFYRTGGMMTINPIRAPGMMCEISPITMTSEMERMDGYGRMILRNQPARSGDVLFIHSVSGRNAVTVDMADEAHKLGMTVIALTNMATSTAVASRAALGKKLYELADILIDNCGCLGDSSTPIDGLPEKMAPTSTAVGAVIVNAFAARAVELIIAAGGEPPVFTSANVDGGDEHNRRLMEKYKDNIFYM